MMVFSILAALRHRGKTGEGQFIEFSMAECVSSLLPEAFMDWAMNGVQHQRIGNRHAQYAPHNVFPCSGFDQWAAISVASEEEWRTLCRVSGHKEWLSNPLFSTENGRKLNEDELDKLISQWTKTTSPVELMKSLQEAGVSAGPVMSVFDLVSNPHVMERGFLVDIDHDEVGPRTVAGLPLRMGEIDEFDYAPTPLLGQHNELVAKDLLGYQKKRYDELVSREVIY
jgi:crotonobetainyl-CoA:carnitine CoA-transferase CaiB-like acyl-CoA transferase